MRKLLFFSSMILLTFSIVAQTIDPVSLAQQYYLNGDLDKAKTEFKKLARNKRNIPRIHENYFKLLLTIKEYKDAEKYIKST